MVDLQGPGKMDANAIVSILIAFMEEILLRSFQFAILSEVTLLLVILHSIILNSMGYSVKLLPIIFLMFNPLGPVLMGNVIIVNDMLLVSYFNGLFIPYFHRNGK